jgi:DNA-binding MarR family transcriptional regulator
MDYGEVMRKVNHLASDLDSLYHQASLKLGLSDSVLFLMYVLYERNGSCPIKDICEETSICKQTINSAIRKLEKEDIIYLKQSGGRNKTVCFTEKGKEYAQGTVGKLFKAESGTLMGWSEEEIEQYLYLTEKYNKDFREQINKL